MSLLPHLSPPFIHLSPSLSLSAVTFSLCSSLHPPWSWSSSWLTPLSLSLPLFLTLAIPIPPSPSTPSSPSPFRTSFCPRRPEDRMSAFSLKQLVDMRAGTTFGFLPHYSVMSSHYQFPAPFLSLVLCPSPWRISHKASKCRRFMSR